MWFRDILSGLLDLYLSSISHRRNEVLKVLTVIATGNGMNSVPAAGNGMNSVLRAETAWGATRPDYGRPEGRITIAVWNTAQSSFWFMPTWIVLGSVAAAVVLIEVDYHGGTQSLNRWPLLFGAGADGARGMLCE